MLALGFVTQKALADWQNTPLYMPHFQFYERHSTTIRTTHPEKILPAIADYDIQQDFLIKTLMSVRQLPQKLLRNKSEKTINQFGPHSFTLLESSTTELCYGLRGQFWRPDFGLEDVPDASAYCAVLRPGNAKLLLRYQVQQLANNKYVLCTETFIYCPDRATRLKMTGYWLAIRLGSGLIRQRTLKAVKHELEKVS
ncbi:hypothetical protein M979_0999 [Buttiauxella noackiae ATCC 51607]|uniref:Uncharacterized protein n=1 Tax=Buttiauxella noackiae ATCC 51607 TaxID=1354255 RepID=A0A1B7HWA8_9ENTR|nr:hypothetical protein [Buttiauxella noackiae]OAT19950.1 hypothetical protein M979_0999 [Buttiauxella noackiae ATCC 51607]